MALTCKNCGGNISLDSNVMICDSCGAQRTLADMLTDELEGFIDTDDGVAKESLTTYKRALSLMAAARTESSFNFAAGVFEDIPNVLNADALAMECREKAKLFQRERIYIGAVEDMTSDDPTRVEGAIQAFRSLGDYKDATTKLDECMPLLTVAQANHRARLKAAEDQRQQEERQKHSRAKRKRVVKTIISVVAVALVTIFIIGYFSIYSSSNVKISISPNTDNYLTEGYNQYTFRYNAQIENKGILDVSAIEADIVFEKNNETVVDTTMNVYNGSSPVVRSQKTSRFTWELTVYSYDTALMLYETDFDDLDVNINITGITYANGKTKAY